MLWEDAYLAGLADEWYRDPQFHAAETIKTAEANNWEGVPWDKIAEQIGGVGQAATDFWIQQRQLNLLSKQQKQMPKEPAGPLPMSLTARNVGGGLDLKTTLLAVGALAIIGVTILVLAKRRS